MANEPERPIEKLLRAAAQRRRDDAGARFELHPANRRLLQGEVGRQFAQPQHQPRSFLWHFGQLWPRVAWSLAIFAVLGVTVWTLIQAAAWRKQTALVAKIEAEQMAGMKSLGSRSPAAPVAASPAPVATPPPSPAVVVFADEHPSESRKLPAQGPAGAQLLAKDKLAAATERSLRENLPPAATPKPSDQPAIAAVQTATASDAAAAPPVAFANNGAGERYSPAARTGTPARVPAAAASAAPAAPPQSSASAMDGLARPATRALKGARTGGTVQRFVQTAPESGTKAGVAYKAKAAQPVLTAFDVEQDGRQLRITDRDGSIYTGYVQTARTPERARLFRAEAPAAAPSTGATRAGLEQKAQLGHDADRLALHHYAFQVAGTNRSLKKNVVFSGNFITPTNLILVPPAATNFGLGGRLADASTDSYPPAAPALLNSRIAGKVVIGSGKPLDVNALPAAP